MAEYTEGQHPFEFVVSESDSDYSREQIVILAGSGSDRVLTAGMVLGARLSGTAAAVAGAGNTGNGAMGAITVTGPAKDGAYSLVFIEPGSDAGDFEVRDPDGLLVGTGTVAVAFSAGGLAFTLADGATDFAAGDTFVITVTQTAKKYLQFDEDGTLGEQVPAGILGENITALDSVDNANGVALVRGNAIVNGNEIVWPSSINAAEKADAIQALEKNLGILVR